MTLPDNLHDEPLLPVAMAWIALAALCGVLLYLADRADQIEQAHLPTAPPEFVAATPHLAARSEPTPVRPVTLPWQADRHHNVRHWQEEFRTAQETTR